MSKTQRKRPRKFLLLTIKVQNAQTLLLKCPRFLKNVSNDASFGLLYLWSWKCKFWKGWDLWSLTNGILCVCSSSLYCEVLDHSHPLAKKVPKLLLMGPNQRQQQQENGGSFCWDLSIRSPPPSSLVSCEFLFFYNGQNCGVGTTKREWMLAKVVQGRQHVGTFSKILPTLQNATLSIHNWYFNLVENNIFQKSFKISCKSFPI